MKRVLLYTKNIKNDYNYANSFSVTSGMFKVKLFFDFFSTLCFHKLQKKNKVI